MTDNKSAGNGRRSAPLIMMERLTQENGLGVLAVFHDLIRMRTFGSAYSASAGICSADDVPEIVLSPDNLGTTFDVRAPTFRDPYHNFLRLSFSVENV
jgi:ABC-type hemin transport system ATPase subunit